MTWHTQSLTVVGNRVADGLSDIQADSWLVQAEMLAHGLPTLRLPKNALLSGDHSVDTRLGFIDAESYDTTFVGESLSQRGSSWRVILGRCRIPVAESRVFRSSEAKSLSRYAASLGYPVELKSVREDRQGGAFTLLPDQSRVAPVLDKLRRRYDGGRVLVQRHYPGFRASFLVVDGQVISVLMINDNEEYKEINGQVHPDLKSLAVDAIRALPGLEDGSVEIIAEDFEASLVDQSVVVDAIAVSPMLRAREYALRGGSKVGPTAQFVRSQARRSGVELQSRVENVELRFLFSGLVSQDGVAPALSAEAKALGVDIVREPVSVDDNSIEALFAGSPAGLALFAFVAVNRMPSDHRAHMVEASSFSR